VNVDGIVDGIVNAVIGASAENKTWDANATVV